MVTLDLTVCGRWGMHGAEQGGFSAQGTRSSADEQARLDLVEQFVVKVQKRNRLPTSVLPVSHPMQTPYERAHALVGALERFVQLCQADGARARS